MCEHGTYATVVISNRYILGTVDACIAPIVQALNEVGIGTKACCCGHGNANGNIALADGREILIARNFNEARLMESVIETDIHGDKRKYTIVDRLREAEEVIDKCAKGACNYVSIARAYIAKWKERG
jgi:hypothetical protein